MHRRSYLPGSRDGIKLNRTKLYQERKVLLEKLTAAADERARQTESLQKAHATIARPFRLALLALWAWLTRPLGRRRA